MSIFATEQYRTTPPSPNEMQWTKLADFRSKENIRAAHCIPKIQGHAKGSYLGATLLEKYVDSGSFVLYILRVIVGIVLVMLTLGLALLSESVRNLFRRDFRCLYVVKPYP